MFQNAASNSNKKNAQGFRHDETIHKFAPSLFCLIGKAGYEMLQKNLGNALPSVSTIHRNVGLSRKIKEGEFRFDDLVQHLKEWKAPPGIHIQTDDTRILQRVEYDASTDRYIGFCLPIRNGVPDGNAFILQTFDDIEKAVKTESCASYAHCIVAKSVAVAARSLILFVLGTDAKHSHHDVDQRWHFIETGLQRRNIKVYSNGTDGAWPFLKPMIINTSLFRRSDGGNVLNDWDFYMMPHFANTLYFQDTVHLLAKLQDISLGLQVF